MQTVQIYEKLLRLTSGSKHHDLHNLLVGTANNLENARAYRRKHREIEDAKWTVNDLKEAFVSVCLMVANKFHYMPSESEMNELVAY